MKRWIETRTFVSALAVSLALACGGSGTKPGSGLGSGTDDGGGGQQQQLPCDFPEAASLLVGGGSPHTGFIELADGEDMAGSLGPQGLYMVTPGLRATNIYPGKGGRIGHVEDPVVHIRIIDGGANVGGFGPARLGLTATTDGAERLGIWAPFEDNLSKYLGKTVTLEADVTDACDRTASHSLDVVVTQ